jgi:HNH endonuclease
MLHILLGNATADVDAILKAAKTRKPAGWIVPMKAHAGDRALFHLPALGLAARGVIGSEPQVLGQGRRYKAMVREITLLDAPVPLAFLLKHHRSWKWPTYPRSYTTIDGRIEERLEELIEGYTPPLNGPRVTADEERQERARVKAEIMLRRGQSKFRQDLLRAYGHRCAISGCDADPALEAAHIRTFPGEDANHVGNGLILRADLHSLFDLGLICVQTSTWTVLLKPDLGALHTNHFTADR